MKTKKSLNFKHFLLNLKILKYICYKLKIFTMINKENFDSLKKINKKQTLEKR